MATHWKFELGTFIHIITHTYTFFNVRLHIYQYNYELNCHYYKCGSIGSW